MPQKAKDNWNMLLFKSINNKVYLDKRKHVIKEINDKMFNFIENDNRFEFLNHVNSLKLDFIPHLKSHSRTEQVWEFIDGKTFYELEFEDDDVEDIVEIIFKFNNVNLTKLHGIRQFVLTEAISNLKIESGLDDRLDKSIDWELIESSYDLVLSHNDIVRGNIIQRESDYKLFLIDFDYVGFNYKYFDLLSFITECDLNSQQEIIAFEKYEKLDGKKIDREYYEALKHCLNVLWYYWAVASQSKVTDEVIKSNLIEIAEHKLRQVRQSIKLIDDKKDYITKETEIVD